MRVFLQPRLRRALSRAAIRVEAAFWLILSRIALSILPFRTIASVLDRPFSGENIGETGRARQRERVQWAIDRAAAFLPGETVCFPRGIAAFMMCRARGINAVLYYGAAVVSGEGLKAHVWLQDGENGVVGHLEAGKYRQLARFPAELGSGIG